MLFASEEPSGQEHPEQEIVWTVMCNGHQHTHYMSMWLTPLASSILGQLILHLCQRLLWFYRPNLLLIIFSVFVLSARSPGRLKLNGELLWLCQTKVKQLLSLPFFQLLVLALAILSCCFCSLYSCCRCALVSIFFFSNEVLILNTTSMICHTQEQNYFLSALQERKRTEACLCKKILDKTVLKAVPFWNSFRITQFNLSFTDILQKGGVFYILKL